MPDLTANALAEATEVGRWLGATDAPLNVIAAQERVVAALASRGSAEQDARANVAIVTADAIKKAQAECKRLNDGTSPTCSCPPTACALDLPARGSAEPPTCPDCLKYDTALAVLDASMTKIGDPFVEEYRWKTGAYHKILGFRPKIIELAGEFEKLKRERGSAEPTEDTPKCSACGRDLHGYRGPLCRYCDGTAE